jgi:hypothetical protein
MTKVFCRGLALMGLVFCLGCGSDNTAADTPCAGSGVCANSKLACIDPGTAVCDTKLQAPSPYYGLCAFRLKVSASCQCIESTVQYCALPTGGAGGALSGIQDCIVSGAATSWGGCHS